jgi:hypothetical protein
LHPDELSLEATKATQLAHIEEFAAFTQSHDCTSGSHSVRANCQRWKAGRLASARQAVLDGLTRKRAAVGF